MMKFRFRQQTNTWPGFVDLFSNLVIILIFLLIVFVFLWTTTSIFNRSSGAKTIAELKETNAQQAETIQQMLNDDTEAKRLLILARNTLENLESDNEQLTAQLQDADVSIDTLIHEYEAKVAELQSQGKDLQQLVSDLMAQMKQLKAQDQESKEQNAQQIANLSEQLASLQSALDTAQEKSRQQEIQYVEMSTRLNKALADKVAELQDISQYQSDFYKAIKNAIGDRTVIRQDGDRFIVSSDILFPSGSYKLSAEGKNQLRLIANIIKDMESKIPSDVNWIIRVDGHTDKKPVINGTKGYRNNTELSLRRATAVSDELARNGVSKRRLVPSGFGDMHPIELGSDATSLQKNRRIELKLTNK